MRLESVNLGQRRSMRLGARTVETGIDKRPVDRAFVGRFGLEGDVVADTENHGGADQAVYVYSRDDYVFWEAEVGRALAPGAFGENLTLSSFGSESVMIGDRYRVGDVLLEVTSPRIPCSTFATHMAEKDWVTRFRDAERPGFYARVVVEGTASTGDKVEHEPAAGTSIEVLELFRLYYERDVPPARLERALAAPIAERARRDLEQRLATAASP